MAFRARPPVQSAGTSAGLKGGNGIDPSHPLASLSVTKSALRTGPRLTRPQHRTLIELTAYYLAERRGFIGGHEAEDWFAAENLVVSRYGIPVIE